MSLYMVSRVAILHNWVFRLPTFSFMIARHCNGQKKLRFNAIGGDVEGFAM